MLRGATGESERASVSRCALRGQVGVRSLDKPRRGGDCAAHAAAADSFTARLPSLPMKSVSSKLPFSARRLRFTAAAAGAAVHCSPGFSLCVRQPPDVAAGVNELLLSSSSAGRPPPSLSGLSHFDHGQKSQTLCTKLRAISPPSESACLPACLSASDVCALCSACIGHIACFTHVAPARAGLSTCRCRCSRQH